MRTVAAALILTTIAPAEPASAISRYESLSRTRASVQQLIAGERAVILRYPAQHGGLLLYDRYATDSPQCGISGYAARAYVQRRITRPAPFITASRHRSSIRIDANRLFCGLYG